MLMVFGYYPVFLGVCSVLVPDSLMVFGPQLSLGVPTGWVRKTPPDKAVPYQQYASQF